MKTGKVTIGGIQMSLAIYRAEGELYGNWWKSWIKIQESGVVARQL